MCTTDFSASTLLHCTDGRGCHTKSCVTGSCGLLDCIIKKVIKRTFFFQKGSNFSCPLHSADFINEIEQIMTQRFHAKTEHDCRKPDCKYRQNSTWTVRCGRGREWLLWYLIIKWLTNLNYFVSLSVLVAAYQWLVCYLLKESAAKLQQELSNGKVVHDPLNFFRLVKWHTLKAED